MWVSGGKDRFGIQEKKADELSLGESRGKIGENSLHKVGGLHQRVQKEGPTLNKGKKRDSGRD